MTPNDNYFRIAAIIWTEYFNKKLSMNEREKLLNELRSKIKFKESKLNDKELMRKIEEARKQKLAADVKDAFK
jgi:hypothetical protein